MFSLRISFFSCGLLLCLMVSACQHGEEAKGGEEGKNGSEGSSELLKEMEGVRSRSLSDEEIGRSFGSERKERLGIRYPIVEAFRYSDREGEHVFVVTERVDLTGTEAEKKAGHLDDVMQVAGDTLKDTLKGHKLRIEAGRLSKEWGLRDFILEDNGVSEEYSIGFWSRYSSFSDMDGDDRIEPFIVYRTLGMNGLSDGRVKMLLYFKGDKYAIRHRNGTLDGQSRTRVDDRFRELPSAVQEKVEQRVQRLKEEQKDAWNLEIWPNFPGGEGE